jgi:mRNA interferase MazF
MATSEGVAPFDIVVVPFPYSDQLAEKRRPALVISNDRLHSQGFVWIAMITGAGKDHRVGDLVIKDRASAGLPGSSMVRALKIATIEPARIVRRIGTLARTERAAVRKAVAGFLSG